MPSASPILCFGETLWDFLPEGLFAGGAPFNVAYHLARHGADARLVSAVGRDLLGDELLRRMRHWKMDTELVARHAALPTGYVRASLGERGDAAYEITANVAWDQIPLNGDAKVDALAAAAAARALVFGSLALRSAFNRASLDRLLATLPAAAWRVFDVNLRPPHDDLDLVHALAPRATLLKVNASEAARLADGGDCAENPGREEHDARALAARHGNRFVCVTSGARGAGLLHDGIWHWEPGREVPVADTVGAGDGFLASLLLSLLREVDASLALARACRHGEWIATQRGATPPYPAN